MTNSPITPLSYTNKDFQTIYPELLELAKELSYKWDPTVSNESDPGVVLLKLNAIIADKNNYNIDKNILETFPSTVTQEVNARNLYKQLGYHMPWYMSANCNIAFRWISDATLPEEGITIPKYTMIVDDIDNCVYTTTQEALLLNSAKETSVSSVQGILVHYNLNGSTLIAPTNIDLDRRLYLNDYTVAENGVFVSSLPNDSSTLQHWSRVDNLSVEPLGQYVYEFGIDVRNSRCYIEFPEDVFSLMGQGVYVDYVISSGELGRVSKNTLNTFYNEVSVYIDGKSTPLTSDNIKITNMSASTGGESPQSIEDAYKSYKKTVGTFNTLVTIRDYINYIYTNNMVSNGFVCDRFNDPQSSYKIITDDGLNPYIDYQKKNESEETFVKYQDNFSIKDLYVKSVDGGKIEFTPVNDVTGDTSNIYKKVAIDEMSAFDLKLYAFSYINPIETKEDYEASFSLLPSHSTANKAITSRLSNVKCVQHDFVDILKDEPCLFKNIFPIKVKVITHSTLSTSEQLQVKQNVLTSLYKSLNSRNIDFGETPSYTEVYNTIMGSDDRIKFIILDDFTYTTLATVWTGNKFIDIPISTNQSQFVISAKDPNDATKKLRQNGIYDFTNYFVKVDDGSTVSLYYWNTSDGNWNMIDYSKCQDIQKSIIAKSVLAGKTPLFQPSGNFEISIEHNILGEYTTDTISTNIAFVSGINLSPSDIESSAVGFPDSDVESINWANAAATSSLYTTIKLKENEQIRFLSPSLMSSANYSTYVKCVLSLNSPTSFSSEVASADDIEGMGTAGKLVFYPVGPSSRGGSYFNEQQQLSFAGNWVLSANRLVDGAASYSKLDTPMLIDGGIVAFYKIEVNLSAIALFDTSDRAIPADGKIIRNSDDEMVACTNAGSGTIYSVPVTIITAENYSIEANSEFQLSNGEYIAFFWRDEQGKDAPFKYKIYRGTDINSVLNVESPIVKPSFRLDAVQGDSQNRNALAFIDTLESEGSLLSGTNNFNTIYNLYGSYVLDSHRTVDMMNLNQVQFSAPDKYYFISRKISNNSNVREYVMDFKRSGEFINSGVPSVLYSYTLENDEYFIRVNSLLSSMEIYTSGTMIGIVTPTNTNKEIELKAAYVEASEFNSKGLDSIKNSMCNIQSSWIIVAREQNIYSFSSGDTVYISNLAQFSSIADDGTIISDSRNSEDFPDRGLCICSWGDTYFYSADISYQTASDRTSMSLPNLKFNSNLLCWTARASLNVDMSSDNTQVFNSVVTNNTRTLLTFQYVKIDSFKRGYDDESSFGVQTNYDFNSYGGTNIDATLLSTAGDIVPRTFLIYDYASKNDIGIKEDDGSICVEFSYQDSELLSNTSIVLTMDNVDFDAMLCKVGLVSDNVNDILYYGDGSSSTYSAVLGTVSDESLHGIRYLLIPLSSVESSKVLKLTSKRDNPTSGSISKIKFFPMTPVMMSRWQELVGISDKIIVNEVEMLDRDNIFNYIYKIPESVMISNPLESTSFFNSEHIMNSFTIGKALIGYSDTIVGNRG